MTKLEGKSTPVTQTLIDTLRKTPERGVLAFLMQNFDMLLEKASVKVEGTLSPRRIVIGHHVVIGQDKTASLRVAGSPVCDPTPDDRDF